MDKVFVLVSNFFDSNTGESSSHIVCAYSSIDLAECLKDYCESHYMASYEVVEVNLINE